MAQEEVEGQRTSKPQSQPVSLRGFDNEHLGRRNLHLNDKNPR